MAGGDGQERTEQATPKRLQEAAEKGQIARSRELSTLALLLAGAGSLLALGPWLLARLAALMRQGLAMDPRSALDSAAVPAALGEALMELLVVLAPFLILMLVVALFSPMALGGWSFSPQSLGFKAERLDPIKGLGKLFSGRAVMELLKALAKFVVVGGVAVAVLWTLAPELLGLGSQHLETALAGAARLLGWAFLLLTLPLLLVAAVDVPFQLYDHAKNLRMTLQEVKDELKNTEGRPEVKSRIRRLQQEFAQRRMMDRVGEADVVLSNPTHYAVALKYDQQTMNAPVVVAMGVDLVALNIRSRAALHEVPRVESPLLARALYFNAELERPIPTSLYRAVAQVLSYVYQLRRAGELGPTPIVMEDLTVPPELRTQ